jgi:hypothetical protein
MERLASTLHHHQSSKLHSLHPILHLEQALLYHRRVIVIGIGKHVRIYNERPEPLAGHHFYL